MRTDLFTGFKGCVIGSKITRNELKQIQDSIDPGVYLNSSDFVREAIRDKLAAIKVIKCRDVDYETAKKEIIGYFQRKGEAYPDEISEDLELDFDLVRQITAALLKITVRFLFYQDYSSQDGEHQRSKSLSAYRMIRIRCSRRR